MSFEKIKSNGWTKLIPIYALLIGYAGGAVWWGSAQTTKLEYIKDDKIPKLRLDVDTANQKIEKLSDDIVVMLHKLDTSLIYIRNTQKDMAKDIDRIKKKIKLDVY